MGLLTEAQARDLPLVDADEHAQDVDAGDGHDQSAPGGTHQSPGIQAPLDHDAGQRRENSRLTEANRQRADLRARGVLGGLGLRQTRGGLLQLLLRHDRLGRQGLRAIKVGARQRRHRTAPGPTSCARRSAGRADRSGGPAPPAAPS